MEKLEIMQARHSVRKYLDKAIEPEKAEAIQTMVDEINKKIGLHFQLYTDEPGAFNADKKGFKGFTNCKNYISLVGPGLADEVVGYYGELLVLYAQELGLNTCWVALTYKKTRVKAEIGKGERLHLIIALGYGEEQGVPHKSKPAEAISNIDADSPQWFRDGIQAVLLAPTAINQQKFYFTRNGNRVSAKAKIGVCTQIDLGIARYHFELGAGRENFQWA